MKQLLVLSLIAILASSSMAAISGKAGLAGGGLQIGALTDKAINDKATMVGDIGYAFGSGYGVLSIGGSVKYAVKDNLNAGIGISYSSYSAGVTISGPGNISSGGGVGIGIFADTKVRDNIIGQIGYDTRLGLIALLSTPIRN